MRVRLLYATVVNGGVWPAESVVDVDEAEAGALLRDGLAEMVEEGRSQKVEGSPSTAAGTPPLRTEKKYGN